MANRPYISYETKDLIQLFEKHPNDKKILTELKKELTHRKREKGQKLLAKVEARLSELKSGTHVPEQLPLPLPLKPHKAKQLPPLGSQGILPGVTIPQTPHEESISCPKSSKPQEPSLNPQAEKDCTSATLPKRQWNKIKIWDFLLKIFKKK